VRLDRLNAGAPFLKVHETGTLDAVIGSVVPGSARIENGRNQVTAPIFLLVSQVKLPKRLDLDRDAEWALDSVPGLIVGKWIDSKL
jgi:hypothetical protein